jgi:hypothetical protein
MLLWLKGPPITPCLLRPSSLSDSINGQNEQFPPAGHPAQLQDIPGIDRAFVKIGFVRDSSSDFKEAESCVPRLTDAAGSEPFSFSSS